MNALHASEALRRSMGAAGRRRVEERFSWTTIAQRTLQLYEELAGVRVASTKA